MSAPSTTASDKPRKGFLRNVHRNLSFWVLLAGVLGYASARLVGDPSWPTQESPPQLYELVLLLKDTFISALRLLVAPVVFFSLLGGLLGLGDVTRLRKIGAVAISYYVATTFIAIAIGLFVVTFIHPWESSGFQISVEELAASQAQSNTPPPVLIDPGSDSVLRILRGMLGTALSNPFHALANLNILAIVTNALLTNALLAGAFKRNELGKSRDGGVRRGAGERGWCAGVRRGAATRCRAKLSRESGAISRENRPAQGTAAAPSPPSRHAETSAVGSDALVEGGLVGSGRSREQQQLSERSGSRRRPSTAELGGNLLRCGDGPSDAHGPAAAGADADVDAEDAGEELHPRHPRRGSIAELSVEQGGDGGQLELSGPALLLQAQRRLENRQPRVADERRCIGPPLKPNLQPSVRNRRSRVI